MLDPRALALPVIGAPLAGGPSTPALAAAVCEAGGLGFLAGGYKTADRLADEVAELRAATTAPFGVNLFVIEPYEPDADRLADYSRSLEPEASALGVELGRPRWDDDDWQAKLDLVLDVRPSVVSFTFGCPKPEVLRHLAQLDVLTMVTVTSLAEAREAVARGAASLSVQGSDAGGHRGTWDLDAVPESTPLLDLVPAVVATVDVPVVAGGGAAAAQVGTAYLLAEEAGTSSVHRTVLADPAWADTALTRAYTGRWARGLATRFMADHADAPAGYPHLHHVTAPLRAAGVAAGEPHVVHLWAGTGHAHARAAPARAITESLAP